MKGGTQSIPLTSWRRVEPLAALAAVAEQRSEHGRGLTGLLRRLLGQVVRLLPPAFLAEPRGVVLTDLLPAGRRRVGQLRCPVEEQRPAAEQDDGSSAAHQPANEGSTAEARARRQRSTPTANTSGPWRT